MIDLYYWTTPNGHKITIFLEEAGLPYEIHPVNISKGDQFKPEFLAIAPNNRIPAIVDQQPADGGAPLSLFESGAILQYLAEKTGRFLPADLRGRAEVSQWLFWQMGGLGPMAGQNHHFSGYAPERIPYAIDRYVKETNRLYGVLNKRLADREFVAGDYSIADMASYPWIVPHAKQGQDLNDFPHLKRWFDAIAARPAVQRAYALADKVNTAPSVSDEESRRILFGQTAQNVRWAEAAMTDSPLRFRRARVGDLPEIVAMLADDELGAKREDPSIPLNPRYTAAFAAIEQDPNQYFAVVERDARLIGCLQLSFIPGLSRLGQWRGQIESVRIASSARGQGLGRAMFEWAIEQCRAQGCAMVQLTTDRARPDARRFYESLGFVASHDGMKLSL